MKFIFRNDLYKDKEIILKEYDEAWVYINQGYKVYIPNGLIIDANTGLVIKDK